MLAAAAAGGKCAVWETDDWTKILGPTMKGEQALLSPDGTRILFLSRRGNERGDLSFWDVDEDECLRRYEGLETIPNTKWDLSADGVLALVLLNRTGTLHVYDGSTGEELRRIDPGDEPFRTARFLGATGELVTIDGERTLRVWNARTGEELRSLTAPGEKGRWCRLESSPDGSRLLVTDVWRSLQVLDMVTGELLWTAGNSSDDQLDGAQYVGAGAQVLVARQFDVTTIHDARSGELLARLEDRRPCMIFRAHPLRDELWGGREDGTLLRLDAIHGRAQGRWRPGSARICDMCFARDSLRCAGAGLVRLIQPTMATGNQLISPASVQALDTGAAAGITRRYQYWFRTPNGPCGQMANLTNGCEITWLP